MSLVSAAALSFTSCSSNDELDDNNAGQNKVDKFYMTLTVQTPTSNGTRTAQNNPREASKEESYVTSGTFYLVDANGKIAKSITIDEQAWADAKVPQQGKDGKTTLQVPVEKVTAGTKYSVYFLANATSESPLTDVYTSDLDNKFAKAYATANKFAMFNENDADVKGDSHTVVFTSDNKDANTPAKVSDIIKIDRLTARIDEPTSEATNIKNYDDVENAKPTPEQKKANEDARKAVKSVELTRYAISNVANKTNVMQQWTDATTLSIPTGIAYFQPTAEFGTKTLLQNYGYFNAVTTDKSNKDYVFENNSDDATSMYFEYTVELSDDYKTNRDFEDGTFYRYNKVIYSRIQDIIDFYKDQKAIFDGKDAKTVVDELKAAKADPDSEAKLDEFRKKYDIEVFNNGKTYYVQKIKDQYLSAENTIQRNSIYLLNVKNIFNVGAQVPNGGPDDRTLYYLEVEVSVNPWVLNSYDVNLQ